MQEAERVEYRVRCSPKGVQDRGQCRFSGSCPLGMSPHAIDHHKEHGLLGRSYGDAILVFVAMADEADIRGLDLQ
jgi:hypothetical protein